MVSYEVELLNEFMYNNHGRLEGIQADGSVSFWTEPRVGRGAWWGGNWRAGSGGMFPTLHYPSPEQMLHY